LVSEWQTSGLSVREFCSQRQIREANFYSWRRTLAERDGQVPPPRRPRVSPPSAKFVPVTVVPAAMVEVRCPSGHVVTVTNADRDTLRHLFTALTPEAPC
jgi:transposase-like protein